MMNWIYRVPLIRSVVRQMTASRFRKQWRALNAHNQTVVGERTFPIQNVKVGRMTYGMIHVQSLFEQENEFLEIGNFVSIAPGVLFMLGVNHQLKTFTTFPLYSRYVERDPKDALVRGKIVVEDEVWIGTNAMIFSGVTIGRGAIIAAGAIVTKDVPPFAIVGGNPAKLIRYKLSDEIIQVISDIRLADMTDEEIVACMPLFYQELHTLEEALSWKNRILKKWGRNA